MKTYCTFYLSSGDFLHVLEEAGQIKAFTVTHSAEDAAQEHHEHDIDYWETDLDYMSERHKEAMTREPILINDYINYSAENERTLDAFYIRDMIFEYSCLTLDLPGYAVAEVPAHAVYYLTYGEDDSMTEEEIAEIEREYSHIARLVDCQEEAYFNGYQDCKKAIVRLK